MSSKNILNTSKLLNPPKDLKNITFFKRLGFNLSDEQLNFCNNIYNPNIDIIFCDAIAGAGKTTLAVATACLMKEFGLYNKIVYCFSPVNFQSQIGLLPGGLEEKVAPFMEPLYEAVITLGYMPEKVIKQLNNSEKQEGFIDCRPHTFMRGTNIDNDTILIIDEAQNFFIDELKKVLTRVKGGKTIVIGHQKQCDLFRPGWVSGFVPYIEHFKGKPRVAICELTQNFRGWVSKWADELDINKARNNARKNLEINNTK